MAFDVYGTERFAYNETIAYLNAQDARVVCASPPSGTDGRYKTCMFPKPRTVKANKGPRDEVDITAIDGGTLLLIEVKGALSHCLDKENRSGENDVGKLQRLLAHDERWFLETFSRGFGVDMAGLRRRPALAYCTEDAAVPPGFTGYWVRGESDVVVRPA